MKKNITQQNLLEAIISNSIQEVIDTKGADATPEEIRNSIDARLAIDPTPLYEVKPKNRYLPVSSGVKYDLFPVPGKEKTNNYYVRIIENAGKTLPRIAKDICDKCSLTPADVQAVIWALFSEAINAFKCGERFDMGPFGSLFLTLTSDPITTGYETRPPNIRVKSIQLQPSKNMAYYLKKLQYQRRKEYETQTLSHDKRIANILNHLEQAAYLKTEQIYAMNHCSKSTASRDLKGLIADNRIIKKQIGATNIYFLKK